MSLAADSALNRAAAIALKGFAFEVAPEVVRSSRFLLPDILRSRNSKGPIVSRVRTFEGPSTLSLARTERD